MKKIVIKTVDGKTIRMTAEEYNTYCLEKEMEKTERGFTKIQSTYPNRFAGKRAHET